MLIAFMQKEKILPNLQARANTHPKYIFQFHDVTLKKDGFEKDFKFLDIENARFTSKSDFEQILFSQKGEVPFEQSKSWSEG